VGARSFTELDAWRLANDLKLGVYALIRSSQARIDLEFLDQIRNAAASAPRNIAEGFGRFRPREFSHYLRIANGSLMETSNHLQDGVDRRYFSKEEIEPLQILAKRASAAVTALIRYLQSSKQAKRQNPSTRAPVHPRTRT
jgi:four helix bundle protein